MSADDTVSQILTYGMGNDRGVAFEYSNSGAHIIAAVLHNAVDQPVLAYARTKLFDPTPPPGSSTANPAP